MRLLTVTLLGGFFAALVLAATPSTAHASSEMKGTIIDCDQVGCAQVLPGAVTFEPAEGASYLVGRDAAGKTVGWVARSTDLVNITAYSGHPLVTLIGLDTTGTIVGAELLKHSEPILLVGISVQLLYDFIARYVGLPATTDVIVGASADPKAVSVDIISGATVTTLAQNQTILKTARTLAVATGVIAAEAANPGHFVIGATPLTWSEMERAGVFGRLTVTEEQMGVRSPEGVFVDLWFTIADAPQIGRALLGERDYAFLVKQLEPGQHLIVVFGNGSNSFKGSAFVRGGVFDRVRLEQGMREVTFHDTDFLNISAARAQGAPPFKEGAAFIARSASLDPGAPFKMVFLGSRYDRKSAFSRNFRAFKSEFRLPRSVYVVDGSSLDEPMYVQAWRNRRLDVILLGIFLLFVAGIFAARRFTTANPNRIKRLHLFTMVVSVLLVGVYMHAQPSITQMLTLISSALGEWRWDLFASAPLIFMLWIFIAITSIVWGRGIFCGWVCPYGTLTELIFKAAKKLGIKQWDIRRTRARFIRYLVLAALIPVFLQSAVIGEKLAEVEPFKTTFLVHFWTREPFFIVWWGILLVLAIVVWRPFCRFLCPLGAGLAILGRFRISGPRRRKFCTSCTICAKGCEPAAILEDGTIDPQECLSCMDCEATYRNETVCPPLIGIERLTRKVKRGKRDYSDREKTKLAELVEARKDV